jgi:aquaporin Z
VVLNVTRDRIAIGGLVIGLTLVALHMAFFNVDGLSVNPARSFGPAVFVGGKALVQLWLFLFIPAVAGAVAGWLSKGKIV